MGAGVGLAAAAAAGETAAGLIVAGPIGTGAGPVKGGRVGTAGSTGWVVVAGLVPGCGVVAPAPPGIGPGCPGSDFGCGSGLGAPGGTAGSGSGAGGALSAGPKYAGPGGNAKRRDLRRR